MWPNDYTTFAVCGKVVMPLTGLTPTSYTAVFTLPKSVRNRCVIRVFGGMFVLLL